MKKFLLLSFSLLLISVCCNFMQAQTFVGSEACSGCHSDKYNLWIDSGHPYKFNVVVNNEPPEYPNYVVNYQDQWMDSLGDGSHDWTQIAGVIGGYGWKSRFVGTDGIIVGTASSMFPDAGMGHNQHNFFGGEDHGWVNYDATTENKLYNYGCFKCHTTGGTTEGTWLEGVDGLGDFSEQGIGCESCHGPGSEHIAGPSSSNIDRVYEFAHVDNASGGLTIYGEVQLPDPNGNDVNFLCGTCHNRGYSNAIDAKGGFVKHHEQWDEFTTTEHFSEGGMTCKTCHNPHKRVIWEGDGITMQCGTCHADQVATTNHSAGATCIDCHMPYAAKSGTTRGASGFVGDVRSHLFKITPDTASMFTPDGSWVRDDDEREASLSPAYSCLGCHNNDPDDAIPDKTLEQAVAGAKDMHENTYVAEQREMEIGLYPNPTSGQTNISFNLQHAEHVSVHIYNATGQLVYSQNNTFKQAGNHLVAWNGLSNNGQIIESGYYFVKVIAGNLSSVQKLIIVN